MDLRAELARRSREAELVHPREGDLLECSACAHRCVLAPGEAGRCQVRSRSGETGAPLRAPWGYVGATTLDPIEKKPFFHAWPGARTLTFGMLGCDMRCAGCQNWFLSQALRDPSATPPVRDLTPGELVAQALEGGARVVVASFNEPAISAEWTRAVFQEARAAGLGTAMVSNGHATPEVLGFLLPWTDLVKIDLKAMQARSYRALGGRLEAVLRTLETVAASPSWLEVVTVLVPGMNDGREEVGAMASFLVELDPKIPWHVHGFRPDYRALHLSATAPEEVLGAVAVGRRAGLRFVYPGLVRGLPEGAEDTLCPGCGVRLLARGRERPDAGFEGGCLDCGTLLPGVWTGPGA